MMTSPMTHPKLAEVAFVRLAVTCEVWPDWPDARAVDVDEGQVVETVRRAVDTLADYFAPILAAVGHDRRDLVDLGTEPERSEYDDLPAICGSAYLDVSPGEWLTISGGYCLDLDLLPDPYDPARRYRETDWRLIPVLPEGALTPIELLDARGLTPAVAVEGTDEGWGVGGYEPSLIASFAVAVAVIRKDR